MKQLLLIITIALSNNILFAQQSFTLKQALEYSLLHNLQLDNNQLNIKQTDWQLKEIKSLGLPQVKVSADYQYFIDIPTQFLPDFISPAIYGVLMAEGLIPYKNINTDGLTPVQFGQKNNFTVGIQASQLVFSGNYLIGLEALKTIQELSIKQIKRTTKEIKRDVTKAYYTCLIANENKIMLDKNITLLEKSLKETKEYYKNGFVEQLDIERLELSLQSLLAQTENINRQIKLTEDLLKFQMGLDLHTAIILKDSLSQFTTQSINFIDQSESRIELEILKTQRYLTELNVKKYKSTKWPTIAALASVSANRPSNIFDYYKLKQKFFPTSLIGINVSMPLWDSGTRKAQIQQALIDGLKIDNAMEMMRQGMALEKSKAKTDYDNAMNTINNLKQNIALAQKIYDKTRIKYKEGVGSSIEITQAESKLFETQTSYINAIYQMLIARTDLKNAYGIE